MEHGDVTSESALGQWVEEQRDRRNRRAHGLDPSDEFGALNFWDRFAAVAADTGESATWGLVNAAARIAGSDDLSLPPHALAFFNALARQTEARRVLDPIVRAPALIGSLVDDGPAESGVGVIAGQIGALIRAVPSSVHWIEGSADHAVANAVELGPFDLIVCSPPIGAPGGLSASSVLSGDPLTDEAGRRLEIWHWIAQSYEPALAPKGRMAFLVNEGSLFKGRAGASALDDLAANGIHLHAAVTIPRGFGPTTGIPASLVVFGTTPCEEIFVALCAPDQDPGPIVENLVAHRSGRVAELGRLVPTGKFRGWDALGSEIDLERRLKVSSKLRVTLGDIATDVTRLQLSAADDATAAPGSAVFLHEITGKAATEPPEPTGKGPVRVYQVTLDPERARPEYVAWWFNSDLGKLARASQNDGRHIPRLSRASVLGLPLPLPSLDEQQAAIALHSRVAELRAEIESIEEELVSRPMAARELGERLDGLWSDPTSVWLSRLPFPLASIFERYSAIARIDVDARRERLRHFFQAFAVLGVSLLVPAFQRGHDDWADRLRSMTTGTRDGSHPFVAPTFGSWVEVGSALAKAMRRQSGRLASEMDGAEAAYEALFAIADVEFATEITSTGLWNALRDAKDLRNDSSHDRVLTKQEAQQHLEDLEAVLERVREATPRCFFRADFVIPGESRFEQGVNTYSRARHLSGPSPNFRESPVESLMQMESETLYVISATKAVLLDALPVAPFVQLLPAPAHDANTVYFANGMSEDGRFEMVSYHTESATAQRSELLPELTGLLDALSPPPNPASQAGPTPSITE